MASQPPGKDENSSDRFDHHQSGNQGQGFYQQQFYPQQSIPSAYAGSQPISYPPPPGPGQGTGNAFPSHVRPQFALTDQSTEDAASLSSSSVRAPIFSPALQGGLMDSIHAPKSQAPKSALPTASASASASASAATANSYQSASQQQQNAAEATGPPPTLPTPTPGNTGAPHPPAPTYRAPNFWHPAHTMLQPLAPGFPNAGVYFNPFTGQPTQPLGPGYNTTNLTPTAPSQPTAQGQSPGFGPGQANLDPNQQFHPMGYMASCGYCGSWHAPGFCPMFFQQFGSPYGLPESYHGLGHAQQPQSAQAVATRISDLTVTDSPNPIPPVPGHTDLAQRQLPRKPSDVDAEPGLAADDNTDITASPASQAPTTTAQRYLTEQALVHASSIMRDTERSPFGFPHRAVDFNHIKALDRVQRYARMFAVTDSTDGRGGENDYLVNETKADYGLRSSFTQKGKHVNIAANYFLVSLKNVNPKIYVYNVEMYRQLQPREIELRNRFCKESIFESLRASDRALQTLRQNVDFWATNYDTIWSVKELFPAANTNQPILFQRSNQQCYDRSNQPVSGIDVLIKRDRVLDLSRDATELFRGRTDTVAQYDDPAILVNGLNAFLTKVARSSPQRVTTSANKFYWTGKDLTQLDTHPRMNLQQTIQALSGFVASTRPSSDQLLMNINTVTSPFLHAVTVQEYARRLLSNINNADRFRNQRNGEMSAGDLKSLQASLRGLRVTLSADVPVTDTHNSSRSRVITELHPQATVTATSTFQVNVGKPMRLNNRQNEEWYHAGQLTIEPFQPVHGQLSPHQTEAMISCARRTPTVNAHLITRDGTAMFGFDTAVGCSQLANLNLAVDPRLIELSARVLGAPSLEYGLDQRSVPREASWNLAGQRFVSPALSMKKFTLLELRDRDFHHYRREHQTEVEQRTNLIRKLVDFLASALTRHGIVTEETQVAWLSRQTERVFKDHNQNYDEQSIIRSLKSGRIDFSDCNVVVLPNTRDYELYAVIKRASELHLGIKTLCVTYSVLASHSKKPNTAWQQLTSNLALKCNLKGAGDNHYIQNDFSALFGQSSAVNEAGEDSPDQSTPELACDTIVIGADVAHPLKAAAPGCPSIAGVVGSVDDRFVLFPGSMRLQPGRKETISKLRDMVKERLIDWAGRHNNRLPKRMLFYRDGVSESQYDKLIQEELPQLHKAYRLARAFLNGDHATLQSLGADNDDDDKFSPDLSHRNANQGASGSYQVRTPNATKGKQKEMDVPAEGMEGTKQDGAATGDSKSPPETTKQQAWDSIRAGKEDFKLTYVVVGKRHNTRFYALNQHETYSAKEPGTSNRAPTGNVMPGTLVDSTITHPYSLDFFLQSHKPIAGTGRSAHYFVLTNQMQLSTDDLQKITHAFCYTYAKATRGVSYCAPAFYADRLCDRGRAYLRDWLLNRGGQPKLDRGPNEDMADFKGRVMRHIYNSDYWRPSRNLTKYGTRRRNPWHPNLDDIMFYL